MQPEVSDETFCFLVNVPRWELREVSGTGMVQRSKT